MATAALVAVMWAITTKTAAMPRTASRATILDPLLAASVVRDITLRRLRREV